jgi:hypothetical protein
MMMYSTTQDSNETKTSLKIDFFEENPTLTLPEGEGILRKLPPLRGGSGWGSSKTYPKYCEIIVYCRMLVSP